MMKLLLAGGILIGGYMVLDGQGRLPQSFSSHGTGSGGKILTGGSVAGTVAGGVKGAARKLGN
jgi:hypothetical protein